jgi:two-component system, NtrC family, sensor kinase
LSRPLANLTAAAVSLGKGKGVKVSSPPADPAEIKTLADSFNTMTDMITRHTAELTASREKAQKALDDYLEVLGFVAHELKSPIASSLTQLMVVENGYAGKVPKKMSSVLSNIHRSLQYGNEMALSFNQLSRAETEGFAAQKQMLADFAEEIVRPAIADVATEAGNRHMTFRLDADRIAVSADSELMRVVMDNLIGNAAKYGQEGTEIQVTCRMTNGSLYVEVTNQGVGVPRDRFNELFTKFRRIHDAKLSSLKGTGVGLYLVKKIVELHGGRVGVDGEYEKWIRFWFEIPATGG